MIDILTSCNFFDVDYFLKNTIRNSFGPLAQLVEQFPFKEWVTGSNPVRLTINLDFIGGYFNNYFIHPFINFFYSIIW